MALDHRAALAVVIPDLGVTLERGRLRSFAAAVGDDDPVHLDVEAARAAGHPDVLAMPTFLFSLELEHAEPFGYLDALGVDLRGVLHGEQSFTFHAPLHAGDTVTVRSSITEAYAKNPQMDFLVKHTDVLRGDELVGESDSVIVVRQVAA